MTRAVVLARGLGTRMSAPDVAAILTDDQRRAAASGRKAMMPINGHPFVAYLLSALADAGLTDVALVVAPDHDALQRYLAAAPPARVRVALLVQDVARGTADAVLAAQEWTATDPFLVMNADNIYPVPALRDLTTLDGPGFAAFDAGDLVASSNIAAERVRRFAIVRVDEDGYLLSIVEKPPDAPAGQTVSMNLWRFDARIYDACRVVPLSARGELELPEAVGVAIRGGVRFRAVPARGPVLDLSQRADAADVGRRLLGTIPRP
jgi:dTDP-glucose pyrophosphorylase